MLFTVPLVILIVGYALGLWFAATGRHFVRRFFFLPMLVSLALTLAVASRFEHKRLIQPTDHPVPTEPENPAHFVPLYALRVAPIALGLCLIVNAAGYFAVMSVHRRFRKHQPPVASGG